MKILILFRLPERALEEARRVAPEADVVTATRGDESYGRHIADSEIIVGWPAVDDLPKARKLRWLQLASAGANRYIDTLRNGVMVTNASGVFGIPMAEHVFAMMLALVRGLPGMIRNADQRGWKRAGPTLELHRSTCGILGLGDIGGKVAKRAKAFGMAVIGLRRQVDTPAPAVDEVVAREQLPVLLSRSDHIVNALPSTPHTYHMIDAEMLSHAKKGAFIYNVGRGSTIDEEALVEALSSGRLSGAGLDVFEDEPLPRESPLWTMPNVIVSPHCAGSTPFHAERLANIFLTNLKSYVAGKTLTNLVDPYWEY